MKKAIILVSFLAVLMFSIGYLLGKLFVFNAVLCVLVLILLLLLIKIIFYK